ncbi:MAG TPA: MarR family transcriptional regulator [Solirubrobacteraceae bacterium]|nr:MarR family transcriptional regulator [Solirubrobacteraceae bacterium]
MADQPLRLRLLPSWLIAQLAVHAQRITQRRFELVGMRRGHFAVLTALADFGPQSQAELGRHLQLDRSDIAAATRELERAGHIQRSRDAGDRRRNLVALTPAGVFALRQLDAHVTEAQEELLAPLLPAERSELARLLARLVEFHGAG